MNEVKQPKKPLIYYYCIAILVLMLFNFLAMPWLMQRQIIQVDYGTFMTMIEERDIGQVEIKKQKIRSSSPMQKTLRYIRPVWSSIRI